MGNWDYFGVNTHPGFTVMFPFFLLLALWELAWKGWAMWKAAESKETGWFIALLIFNTIGILPILYIYVFSKKK